MSVIGSNILAGASGQGGDYTIARSLRTRGSATGYLSRTPLSAGSLTTWTWSAWVKRGNIGNLTKLFSAGTPLGVFFLFEITTNNTIVFGNFNGTVVNYSIETTQVFRDPSAWYHVVAVFDTTQATASNRMKIYINGSQVTALTATYPSQNTTSSMNGTFLHQIANGVYNSTEPFDGYLTEINFIDGQALTPSSFGATNASTGVWQPKKYAGTYGTNGFYLPFTNNSTTTTLGNDFSGNGNNWTTNNISLTAGSTYDSMTDVPTLTSATAANFAVVNPLDVAPSISTISNGNLKVVTPSSGGGACRATMSVSSGKWYWEATPTANATFVQFGIVSPDVKLESYLESCQTALYFISGNKGTGPSGSNTPYGSTIANNDVVGIALDMDAGTLTFYKNGSSMGTAFTGISGTYTAGFGDSANTVSTTIEVNFGQRPFAYTPPTGFVALNTFNLPTPTIGATASTQANKYFDISLYTGTGSAQSITNSGGFQPDFVWGKARSTTRFNVLVDAVRGSSKDLYSNATNAENTDATVITGFNSNGFGLGTDAELNLSANTFVAWQWNAGGSTVTNTSGSISSQVRANTSAGFSVVTYTGTGANATVGHGLGVAPKMVIVKKRNGADQWFVNQTSASATAGSYLKLDSSAAVVSGNADVFNNTNPSSTVVTLGTDNGTNASGGTYVAYCFSEVAGYSKFSSYIGNANADGTFVYLGFRPRYVMIKRVLDVEDWIIFDTARNTSNLTNLHLYANLSAAQSTAVSGVIDIVSNGFKIRGTGASVNGSGETYIYMAFAENPFKYSLAR